MRRSGQGFMQRVALFSFAVMTVLSMALSVTMPFFQGTAGADANPSAYLNLIERGGSMKFESNTDVPFGTCEAYWDTTLKTQSLLGEQFYSKMGDLPYNDDPKKLRDLYDGSTSWHDFGRTIESRVGSFGESAIFGSDQKGTDYIVYILQKMGTMQIPVIRFKPAPANSNPLSGNYSSNGSICGGNYMMIPVSDTEWRGFEKFDADTKGTGYDSPEKMQAKYMEFKLKSDNSGELSFWTKNNGGEKARQVSGKTLLIGGTKPGTSNGGGASIGTINAAWQDAATIKVTSDSSNGRFAGEVYRKHSWNTRKVGSTHYSYYFLETASTGRESLTWNSNSKKCEDALPLNSACGGGGICVPFIAIKQQLNVEYSDSNLVRLQKDINQLRGATADLYDFSPDTCLQNGGTGHVNLSAGENASIWLYYSKTNNAMLPVFSTGDGNELNFIGTYGKLDNQSGDIYALGQCIATIAGSEATPGEAFTVKWTLTDGNCAGPKTYGTLTVKAIGGASGESAFTTTQTEQQDSGNQDASEAKFVCELGAGGILSFNWIFCPLTRMALDAVDKIELAINKLLTLDVDSIFNSKNDGYYKIWASFRTLALALIAIAALIMVVSQVAGVELLDAYTIKKVLPRLLFAAIAITVSWPIMKFLVTLSNDIGGGIRYLIYSPFPKTTDLGVVTGTGVLATLLGAGSILAFGVLGMLSFVVTAFFAVAIAFGVLVFRELLVIFLVITAPFAIACYILPNTQRVWKLWKDAFISVLLVFVIITTFIAIGHVFAIIALTNNNNTLNQIVAIIAYILPYFLITTAFRMAGGIMSTVGGLVNDRTKGGFDRLRNFRSERRQDRAKRWKEGRLYDNNSLFMKPGDNTFRGRMAKRINTMGERRAVGLQGRYGLGSRGQTAMANAMKIRQMEGEKDAALTAASLQDDNVMFAMAMGNTDDQVRAAVNARWGEGSVQAQQALEGARALGINRVNQSIMMDKMTKNKARAIAGGDTQWVELAARNLAAGNQQLFDKSMQDMQFNLRDKGRADLGGTWHANGKKVAEWAQAFEASGDASVSGGPKVEFGYNDDSGNYVPVGQISQRALAAAKQQVATDNGADRVGVQALIAGHPYAVASLRSTTQRALKHGSLADKEKAAMQLLEASKGLSAGLTSGSTRDEVTQLLNDNGIALGAEQESVARRLADMVGHDPLDPNRQYTPEMLTARARVYDMAAERANQMNPNP